MCLLAVLPAKKNISNANQLIYYYFIEIQSLNIMIKIQRIKNPDLFTKSGFEIAVISKTIAIAINTIGSFKNAMRGSSFIF
jgi:hypothetical protein